jgi:hypothetical protein
MEDVDKLLSKYAKVETEVKTENQEGGTETAPVETKPVDGEPTVDISQFKAIFGEEVTIDEVKKRYQGWGEVSTKVQTLEEQLKEKEDTLAGYKSFAEAVVDPTSLYANDDIRFLNNVVKKYPSLDYSVASRLVTQDAKELSDVDAIAIADAMENSEYSLRVDEAELKLMKRLGIESREELDDLSAAEKRLLAVDARKARALIARTQEEVKQAQTKQSPEEFIGKHQQTVKEQVAQSKKAYEPIIDTLIAKVEGVVEHNGKQLTTIKLDEAYKKELKDFALEQIGNFRMGSDEESQKAVINNIQYKVWGDKRGEILSAMESDIRTQVTQEIEQKYTNHKPTNIQAEATKTVESGVNTLTANLPKSGWG